MRLNIKKKKKKLTFLKIFILDNFKSLQFNFFTLLNNTIYEIVDTFLILYSKIQSRILFGVFRYNIQIKFQAYYCNLLVINYNR